jgi:hypothetical protein
MPHHLYIKNDLFLGKNAKKLISLLRHDIPLCFVGITKQNPRKNPSKAKH